MYFSLRMDIEIILAMLVISGMIREEKRATRNSARSACSIVHVSVCGRERGCVQV